MGGGGGVGGRDGSDSSSGGGGSFNFFLFSSKHKPFILYNFKQNEEWSSNLFVFINCEKYSCAKVFQFISSAGCGENEAYEPFFLSRRKGHLQSLSLHKERTAKDIFCKNFCNDFTILPRNTRKQKQKNITHNIVMMGMF